MDHGALPIAIVGAGPVGLAAAAHVLERGATPLVLEAGATVGASVQKWGHVRLFTPWRYAVDAAAARLLEAAGWRAPDPEAFPTGADLLERYLAPLAALPQLAPHIRLGQRVVAVTRLGFDKLQSLGRDDAPFLLVVENADGGTEQIIARAVIDASGTYTTPNPLGAYGLPARNEPRFADRIFYGIPDVLGADRKRYANRTVLVAGSGASAFNTLLDLARLSDEAHETRLIWLIRKRVSSRLYGGGEDDQLPERGALGRRVQALVEAGRLQVADNFKTTALHSEGRQIVVLGEDRALGPVDEIVVTTGFRPDLAMHGELRLALDPAVESPVALAPLIDPNFHSCGTVRPHGVDELQHPEAGFYIVGSKSYGRAPTFLLLTGYEQARSVVAAISGDWAAAHDVQLVLPETGVCCTTAPDDGVPCCGDTIQQEITLAERAPALITIGASDASACCG